MPKICSDGRRCTTTDAVSACRRPSTVFRGRSRFLSSASAEYAEAASRYLEGFETAMLSTLRYARIPTERATEWAVRLGELTHEFTAEKRGGDTTFGLLVALYPTDRPHLPDAEEDNR